MDTLTQFAALQFDLEAVIFETLNKYSLPVTCLEYILPAMMHNISRQKAGQLAALVGGLEKQIDELQAQLNNEDQDIPKTEKE